MTPHALGPYWYRINYHGAIAPHSQTLPCKTWSNGTGAGNIDIWSGGTVAAATMADDLVTLMLPFFNSDVVFDNFVIYRQLTEDDDVEPVASGNFTGKVGTNTGGSWAGAVELMIIARSVTFNLAKLVLLDACSEDDFNPIYTPAGVLLSLVNEWASDSKGWAARDNSQVGNFLKMTVNLNQKLRKEYRLD